MLKISFYLYFHCNNFSNRGTQKSIIRFAKNKLRNTIAIEKFTKLKLHTLIHIFDGCSKIGAGIASRKS